MRTLFSAGINHMSHKQQGVGRSLTNSVQEWPVDDEGRLCRFGSHTFNPDPYGRNGRGLRTFFVHVDVGVLLHEAYEYRRVRQG